MTPFKQVEQAEPIFHLAAIDLNLSILQIHTQDILLLKVERKVKAAFPVFQLQEWLGGSGNRQAGILSRKRESLESPNMPLTELPAKPPKSRPRYRGTIVED